MEIPTNYCGPKQSAEFLFFWGRTLRYYVSPKQSEKCFIASVQMSSYLLVKVPPATICYQLLHLRMVHRERGKPFTCYLRVMHARIITVKSYLLSWWNNYSLKYIWFLEWSFCEHAFLIECLSFWIHEYNNIWFPYVGVVSQHQQHFWIYDVQDYRTDHGKKLFIDQQPVQVESE